MSWMTQQQVAGVMGYLSIACWLCAQLPQVVKNARLRSCEGLALPFLINWLFGDITNLIGCILTDQLPFQTYLAGYFCLIDFALVLQFFHYKPDLPLPTPTAYSTYAPAYTPSQSLHASLILPPRASSRPGTIRTRSTSSPTIQPLTSVLPHHGHGAAFFGGSDTTARARPRPRPSGTPQGSTSDLNSPVIYTDGSYAAIYEAALDVARMAERVSARRSESRRRRLNRQNTAGTVHTMGRMTSEEDMPAAMMESFHSEMSGRSGRSARSAMTTSTEGEETHNDKGMTTSTGGLLDGRGGDGRGRTLTRHLGMGATPHSEELDDQFTPLAAGHISHGGHMSQAEIDAMARRQRDKSRSLSMARGSSGRGGRRAAGVAFMSLSLVVRGWYGLTPGTNAPVWAMQLGSSSTSMGRVVTPPAVSTMQPRHPPIHAASAVGMESRETVFIWIQGEDDHHHHDPSPDPPQSFQRQIGRISAWSCTTLYLTSRLPQIWKNFTRKSVEGLSILLFLFAFCGNLAYVFSILLNPSGSGDPSEAGHYLLEALPYLLGSGGTLMFDLTIMLQSYFYGSDKPVVPFSSRRLRLPGRRKHKHVEDASVSVTRGYNGSSERNTERTPLLGNQADRSVVQKSPMTRERSLSPDVVLRHATAGEAR